jgi:hypothetical protein
MSVNNNAGLPVFEVFSDDRVVAGRFGQNDFIMTSGGNIGIGTGVPSSKFHVVGFSTFNGDVSSTGSFIAGSGSAGNPSFEFSGDTDTGMFTPSGNVISFATSGVERLRIDNIGRVGIGTTAPTSTLQVSGLVTANSGNFTNLLTVNGTGVWHSGNFDSSNIVRTTGTQTIGANKTFSLNSHNEALIIGNSSLGFRDGSADSDFNDLAGGELNLELTTNNGFGTKFFVGSGSVGVSNVVDGGGSGPYRDRLFFDVASSTSYPGGKTTLTTSSVTNNITIALPNTSGTLALLTNINTSQITGVLPVNKGGTNITSYSNGQLLIGSGTSLVANTLTAGTGISITNGSGTITINSSLSNPVTGTGTGASTSGYLPRWNSTSGLNNSDIYQSGSNIGIGIVNPTSKLHVAGDILATGSFIGGSGTAALPSFEFAGDPDTGLFSPAADTIGLTTNGVERLRINSTGNVGIGTSSPTQKLDIVGNIAHSAGDFVSVQGTAQHLILVARGLTLSGSFTIDIATATFTRVGHSLRVGDTVKLSTTGALPTGLNTTTNYYVISAGLTGNTFRVSTTSGGSAIVTSGTQSGTHTLIPTTSLTLNGATGLVTPSLLVIPERSTWSFTLKISAYSSQNNQGGAWWVQGGLRKNLSSTIELETAAGYQNAESSFGAPMSLIEVNADTINSALDIRVVGILNNSVRWAAVIDIIQVSFGTPYG